jgi:flagellar L-ring protein precursor FlgH
MRIALVALAAVSLSACSTVVDTVRGPNLTPMGYPAQLVPRQQEVVPISVERTPASANSLWRTGARAFFIDQRAHRVGDILTVQIDIDDRASTTNSSSSSRTSGASLGVPHFLGFESTIGKVFPSQFDPANAIETASDNSNAGSGTIQRQEKISLTIAATVAQVLPNGNMVIQGTQEVKTNNELRQLTVSGIVRPEDITAANTIRHTQIAEARISYGGRGDQSRVQRTPAGQALVEHFSPF